MISQIQILQQKENTLHGRIEATKKFAKSLKFVGKRNDAIAAPVVANSIRVNHSEKFQPFLYPKNKIAIFPRNMFIQAITCHVKISKPSKSILGT